MSNGIIVIIIIQIMFNIACLLAVSKSETTYKKNQTQFVVITIYIQQDMYTEGDTWTKT